jgi:hypothetical protein
MSPYVSKERSILPADQEKKMVELVNVSNRINIRFNLHVYVYVMTFFL